MKITHSIGNNSISKDVKKDVNFMLTDKAGSFASFSSFPMSKYNGFFVYENGDMFKILDWIKVDQWELVRELSNNFTSVERKRGGFTEGFFMPKNKSCLVYEVSEEKDIEVVFDIRRIFDFDEWGREYAISVKKNMAVVEFTKKKEGIKDFKMYAVVIGNKDLEMKNDWIEHYYGMSERRKDPPYHWHVFYGLKMKGSKLAISASSSRRKAIKRAKEVFSNTLDMLKEDKKEFEKSCPKKLSSEADFAGVCALNSLGNLTAAGEGLFAGLPWFSQFWIRDESISLNALIGLERYELVKDIIMKCTETIGFDGRAPAVRKGGLQFKVLNSADGLGWTFRRLQDLIDALESGNKLKRYLPKKDLEKLKKRLEDCISLLIRFHTRDNLAFNNELETWMDTMADGDNRRGARIEVQALRLSMYRLMYEFTDDMQYKNYELRMKKAVVKNFWNRSFLADGLDDFTIRPNIFLAAYIYPDILHKSGWRECFRNVLPSLWLRWGGLSSIDKKNRLFCHLHTGFDVRSYHRGDSWFWVNNIAAIVMNRTDKKAFKKYITKILEASVDNILWKGCVGCASELSSADELTAEGCWNQAWSNATFLELIDELNKDKKFYKEALIHIS